MQFILFLLSFALNPVVLMHVPVVEVASFFAVFSVANMCFSLFFTIFFSYEKSIRYVKNVALVYVFLFIVGFLLWGKLIVWALYPFALLLSDYVTSQSGREKLSLVYRCFLIISVLPIFIVGNYFFEFIIFRSLMCLIFAFVILLHKDCHFVPLAVKSPFKMIAVTYVFYSGSLMFLAFLGSKSPLELKHWYIGTQIGLGLVLKKIDFSLRALASRGMALILRIVMIGVVLIPVFLMFLHPNMIFLGIYTISGLALLSLKPEKK